MLRGHKLFCFNQWPLLYAVVQWNNCISHLILASAVLVFVDYIFNMAARSFLLKRLPWRYSVQSHSCWCGKGWSKKKIWLTSSMEVWKVGKVFFWSDAMCAFSEWLRSFDLQYGGDCRELWGCLVLLGPFIIRNPELLGNYVTIHRFTGIEKCNVWNLPS